MKQDTLKLKLLTEELQRRGITMSVNACGCCDSPWVKVAIDNVVILDEDSADFDMFDKETK